MFSPGDAIYICGTEFSSAGMEFSSAIEESSSVAIGVCSSAGVELDVA
jgi:hypothetical protein